jgi:hypothetical protein
VPENHCDERQIACDGAGDTATLGPPQQQLYQRHDRQVCDRKVQRRNRCGERKPF